MGWGGVGGLGPKKYLTKKTTRRWTGFFVVGFCSSFLWLVVFA